MAERLLKLVRHLEAAVVEAGARGETVFTAELVRSIRREFPNAPFSSAALSQLVIDVAAERGVPVRIEVPLEVIGEDLRSGGAAAP